MPGPIDVFISYAPQDVELRREFEEHLSVLRRQGLIKAWHVGQVEPGQGWRIWADGQVRTTQIIFLLVSASFFASDDCHDCEMGRALERWRRGDAQVVPILLRPSDWEHTELGRLQPLPGNRCPITSWSSRDEAWADVVSGIRAIVARLAGFPPQGYAGHVASAPAEQAPDPSPPALDLATLTATAQRLLARELLQKAPATITREATWTLRVDVGPQPLVVSVRAHAAKDRGILRSLEHTLEMMDALDDRIRFLEMQQMGAAGLAFDFGREVRTRRGELEKEAANLSGVLTLLVQDVRAEK
ncbi:toll/interleukin-1 receptor domain-containing protein [Sorangium sp. So ce341]|uniref:toll/interleukin-1 receptor domain-containing protein n=1 Tax=Sorangium sp. So ce341 TaxID=3133302 RepID=UPI003F637120